MPFNPATLAELEGRGLSNADLELLLALLHQRYNGSLSWHCTDGRILKYELQVYGKTGQREPRERLVSVLGSKREHA
jgi:hypothetical protein